MLRLNQEQGRKRREKNNITLSAFEKIENSCKREREVRLLEKK